jgi:hypothetical protein
LQFERIHSIKPNVDKLFSLQPKTKFEIRRTEIALTREKTASAECNQVQLMVQDQVYSMSQFQCKRIQYVW